MEGIGIALLILLVIAIFTSRAKIYVPQGWHFAGPTAIILLGIAILKYAIEKYQEVWVWVVLLFANAPLTAVAWYWSKFLYEAGVIYQKGITQGSTPTREATKTEAAFTPTLRAIPELKAQVVEMPTFNIERRFAIDMLRMYDFDPITQKHVNATEALWVKTKKQFTQMGLRNTKERWIHFGLFKRDGDKKNARYIVADRRRIALVAEGNALPDWVPPPPSE